MTDFEFFDEIPMDKGHTLDQQTARFQGVKDGLPELVKNTKDQYARLGVLEKSARQIVVIANAEKRYYGEHKCLTPSAPLHRREMSRFDANHLRSN